MTPEPHRSSNCWRKILAKRRKNLTPEERARVLALLREVRDEVRVLRERVQTRLDARPS
jgi:hypothetical protein